MTREDALLECLTRWGSERDFHGPYAEETKDGFIVGFHDDRSIHRIGRGTSWEDALENADYLDGVTRLMKNKEV